MHWALFFEKVAKIVCSRYATISLVPDSEGLKPKRNDDNSCVLRNSINKPLYGGHVMSIMIHAHTAGGYLPGG